MPAQIIITAYVIASLQMTAGVLFNLASPAILLHGYGLRHRNISPRFCLFHLPKNDDESNSGAGRFLIGRSNSIFPTSSTSICRHCKSWISPSPCSKSPSHPPAACCRLQYLQLSHPLWRLFPTSNWMCAVCVLSFVTCSSSWRRRKGRTTYMLSRSSANMSCVHTGDMNRTIRRGSVFILPAIS